MSEFLMCLMKFRPRRIDVYRTVWLPQSKLNWLTRVRIGTLHSPDSGTRANMTTTAEKSTCAPETCIFFNCPGQENTIVKYILYLKAKNGTDYIITYCRIDFWSELDYLVTLYMRTALTYLPAVFLSIC